jgi:hypothetical protein
MIEDRGLKLFFSVFPFDAPVCFDARSFPGIRSLAFGFPVAEKPIKTNTVLVEAQKLEFLETAGNLCPIFWEPL